MRGTPAIYFKSLNRHFTVMGVERQLFYLFVGICLPIAFSAHLSPIMDCIALIVFAILYCLGVMVTRADDQILPIYRRHIHYKKYYSANAGIHANLTLLKPSVSVFEGKRGLV